MRRSGMGRRCLWGASLLAVALGGPDFTGVRAAVRAQAPPGDDAGSGMESPETNRVRVVGQLYDASLALMHSHGGSASVPDTFLTAAQVRLQSVSGAGTGVRGETDLEGRVDLELSELPPEGSLVLWAQSGEIQYLSRPFSSGAPPAARIPMFRCSREGRGVLQSLTRVVTENENLVTGEKKVHVRQIQFVQNRGFEVCFAWNFPIPEGADVKSLTVNEEAVPSLEVEFQEEWESHGIPIKNLLYPPGDPIRVMGTYLLGARKGDVVNLGFHATLQTVDYTLALEDRRFDFIGNDGVGLALVSAGSLPAPGVQKATNGWRRENIPAGETLVVKVRFDDPGIESRVWWVTLAWVLGLGAPILIGRFIAGQRKHARGDGARAAEDRRDLDERFARGEVDAEGYRRAHDELRRRSGSRPPADVLEVLEAMAKRRYGDQREIEEDLRTLAAVVRDQLLRRS